MNSAQLLAVLLSVGLAPSAADPQIRDDKPAAPGAARIVLDRAFLVGRWTDDEDCGHAVRFRPDGNFVTFEGSGGRWRLVGDRLTLSGTATITLQLVPLDRDTMEVINPDGSIGRSTRCPGDAAGAPVRDVA